MKIRCGLVWWFCVVLSILTGNLAPVMAAMEQRWVDDLNRRFPGIGDEFRQAVDQKLAQHGGSASIESVIEQLKSSPEFVAGAITNAQSFSLRSELMLLYPARGQYQEALQEAKLLRDFVLKYSLDDERVVQTFRGVYAELLIINEQYEQAMQEVEEMIAFNANEEGNYLSRGVIHVKLGQLERAMSDLALLIQKPDAVKYAQQLFVFIMENREMFQEAQVQRNTMIDVMLRDMEPTRQPHVRIPANLEAKARPTAEDNAPTSANAAAPLTDLIGLTADQTRQILGTPTLESEGEETFDRDYAYRGRTITVAFDKQTQQARSFQMFFLPPVDEKTAFAQLGLTAPDAEPSISSDMLRVWTPYAPFAKVRLSLSDGQVIAMIVEP